MVLTYENPVLQPDFADPGVFWDHRTKQYYGYSTNANGKNVQCCRSPDFCSWELSPHDALPGPYPPWTGKDGFRCWAPEVREAPEGRPGYLMYFSTHDWNTDVMCIATAYSPESPLGPFHFVGNGPIVSQGYQGGTIDPQPFFDPPSQKWYLIFKNDGNHNQTAKTRIWVQELTPDGLGLVGQPCAILEPSLGWHRNLIEAPYLVYHSPSRTYVLFFSSGYFGTAEYATGYATSKTLMAQYKPHKDVLLGTDAKRRVFGPGGISVIEQGPEGNWMVAFHAHDRPEGEHRRQLCVHRLEWTQDGRPLLAGNQAHYGHRLTMGMEHEGDNTRTYANDKQSRSDRPTSKTKKRISKVAQWIKDY